MFSLVNEVDFAITTRAEVDGSTLAVAGDLDLYQAPALAVALKRLAAVAEGPGAYGG